MTLKKIILRQKDNKQYIHYEDPDGIVYKELSDDDFNALLEKLKFDDDFALPDRLVQDYITDGSVMPTFKRSLLFSDEDMHSLIESFRQHVKRKRRPKQNTNQKRKRTKKTKKHLNKKKY
jgi:hypothetical protein